MTLLKHGNSKDNCSGDVTYRQPISKQISYRPYKRIAYFIGYFYKEDFLDWLLDLGDLFDFKRLHVEEYVEVNCSSDIVLVIQAWAYSLYSGR